MENETDLKIKCLRSDNNGEYDSKEFKRFCAENKIGIIRFVPNRPQQNGMNRTLTEHA